VETKSFVALQPVQEKKGEEFVARSRKESCSMYKVRAQVLAGKQSVGPVKNVDRERGGEKKKSRPG